MDHANKMGIVSPLKGEKSLPTLLSNDGRENSILKGMEVNDNLDLDMMITKRCVTMITRLLIVEALHWESIQVKRALEQDALDELR